MVNWDCVNVSSNGINLCTQHCQMQCEGCIQQAGLSLARCTARHCVLSVRQNPFCTSEAVIVQLGPRIVSSNRSSALNIFCC